MSETICDICTEQYNKKTKKCITCKSCDFKCCSVCLENYFKTSKAMPQCMNCHKPWNHQYLSETFGASSLKRILEEKKEILFNEQKALFPHTQEYITMVDQMEDVGEAIKNKNAEIRKKKQELDDLYYQSSRLHNRMHNIESNCLNPQTINESSKASSSKNVYIQQCNKNDCKGFIDMSGVCGLCKTIYCKKCMIEKADGHVCNENDVLSVEMIKKDSKSCPTCTTLIYRISGCPDMFCTSCHTSFNWNTLRIDKNGNSNPLYYRWLREGAGLPTTSNTTMDCDGRTFDFHSVSRSHCYRKLSGLAKQYMSDCLQSLHHITRGHVHLLQGHVYPNTNYETLTLKFRTAFMRNKSTEKNFKTQLLKLQKQQEYNSNIRHICNLVEDFRNDSIRRIVLSSDTQRFNFHEYIQSYITFSEYINNCVLHITKLFYNKDNAEFIRIPHFELDRV